MKAIPSAVEEGRIGLQVLENIHKGGNLFLAHAHVREILCHNGTRGRGLFFFISGQKIICMLLGVYKSNRGGHS